MPLRVGMAHTEIKISRAYTHLEELKEVISDYRKNGYTIVHKDDFRKGIHRCIIEQAITPGGLAALPGEFAYCLRSGLDQLAWQLALLTTDVPHEWTAFPIYERPPDRGPKSRYTKSTRDIPSRALAIIEDLQPHKRGAAFKDDLLWQLNELCNIDKHQLLALGCTVFELGVEGVSYATRKNTDFGTEIIVPLVEKKNLELDVRISHVVFGNPIDAIDGTSDFEIGIERLEEIYNFVNDRVVPRFKKFFK